MVSQWEPFLSFKRKFSFRKSSIVSDIPKFSSQIFVVQNLKIFLFGDIFFTVFSRLYSQTQIVDSLLLHTVSSIICWIRGRRLVWIILEGKVTQLNRKILGSDNYWLHDELSNPPGGVNSWITLYLRRWSRFISISFKIFKSFKD